MESSAQMVSYKEAQTGKKGEMISFSALASSLLEKIFTSGDKSKITASYEHFVKCLLI